MPERISIDGAEPVTLSEAKNHCYVTGTRFDEMLIRLIIAAREYAENECWRTFTDSTYALYLDSFPEGDIELERPPIISVQSITYVDRSGDSKTFTGFNLSKGEYGVLSGDWPQGKDVTITYKAGYGGDILSAAPKVITQAILLLVGHLFDNRDAVVMSEGRSVDVQEVPMGVEMLLNQYGARVYV